MTEFVDMEDGIYFGLPEAAYHAIPRLSTSGIKLLVISSLEFWFGSWLNAEFEEEDRDTPAKKLGRAYHKLILEGDGAFEAAYVVAPTKDEYPEAISGAEDLRARCGDLGLKRSGTIAEMCERILEADPAAQLWPVIMAEFNEEVGDREILPRDQWIEIERVRFVLDRMPDIKGAFTGGYPEVTILWTDKTGVRMKARIDYLKARKGEGAILDLKSFGNVMGNPIDEAPESEISRNDYFIQPVAYSEARMAARAMWAKHGRDCVRVVSGPEPSDTWLSDALEPEKARFHFVFVKTGGVPDIVAAEFADGRDFSGLGWQANAYWQRGLAHYRYGLALFRRCMAEYGPDAPWIVRRPVRVLQDETFPPWALSKPIPFIDDEAA